MHARTWVALLAVIWCIVLLLLSPAVAQEAKWQEGGSLDVDGLKVRLSRPRLVHRSSGYLWFPSLHHFGGGRLLAVLSTYADEAQDVTPAVLSFSREGGLTWSRPTPGRYSELMIPETRDQLLLLPMYLRLKSERAAIGTAQRWTAEGEYKQVDAAVEVLGWPRKIGLLDADLGSPKAEWKLASFVFNGQTLLKQDGKTHLATLYGRFAGCNRYSLVLAESSDGLKWSIRSVIADETCKLPGKEGPCESALIRLKDDRLLCVYRLDSGVPYGHSFSNDDGKTWSEPKNLDGPLSVQPSLALSGKGVLLLSGGRPGLCVWLNRKGDAIRWNKIDLAAHHNKWVEQEPILKAEPSFDSNTTAYTEVRWLDDEHFLVIYDRLANGWRALPADTKASNSIWVVRGRVE